MWQWSTENPGEKKQEEVAIIYLVKGTAGENSHEAERSCRVVSKEPKKVTRGGKVSFKYLPFQRARSSSEQC